MQLADIWVEDIGPQPAERHEQAALFVDVVVVGQDASPDVLIAVQPDGATVEHHYWPEFPPQVADVSYGLTEVTTTVTLLTDGANAGVLIPADGSLGTSWTAEACRRITYE